MESEEHPDVSIVDEKVDATEPHNEHTDDVGSEMMDETEKCPGILC